jgi:hypothetical protein
MFALQKNKLMSKIIGGIFTVIGTFLAIFLGFLYLNSSAYLSYNDPARKLTYLETGYMIPTVIAFFLLTVGLTFLIFSKDPNTK